MKIIYIFILNIIFANSSWSQEDYIILANRDSLWGKVRVTGARSSHLKITLKKENGEKVAFKNAEVHSLSMRGLPYLVHRIYKKRRSEQLFYSYSQILVDGYAKLTVYETDDLDFYYLIFPNTRLIAFTQYNFHERVLPVLKKSPTVYERIGESPVSYVSGEGFREILVSLVELYNSGY